VGTDYFSGDLELISARFRVRHRRWWSSDSSEGGMTLSSLRVRDRKRRERIRSVKWCSIEKAGRKWRWRVRIQEQKRLYRLLRDEEDAEKKQKRPTSTVLPVYISPRLTSKFVNIPGPLCTCCPPPPPKNLANGSFPPPCLRASCCFNPSSPWRSYIFLVFH